MRGAVYVIGLIALLIAFLGLLSGTFMAFAEGDGTLFSIVVGASVGCGVWAGILLMLVSIDERLEDTARWAARAREAEKAKEFEGDGL